MMHNPKPHPNTVAADTVTTAAAASAPILPAEGNMKFQNSRLRHLVQRPHKFSHNSEDRQAGFQEASGPDTAGMSVADISKLLTHL